jgi:phosphodiesterase/alkaline phosphatase D-like protein
MSIPLIVCGPIIGTVTQNTARVLLEVENDCEVIMKVYNDESIHKYKEKMKARMPVIFKFENLKSGSSYTVGFDQEVSYENLSLESVGSNFRTLSNNISNTRFLIISCNAISKELITDKQYSLWKHLSENIESFDYALHIGDQIYLDWGEWFGDEENVYHKVKKILHDVEPKDYHKHDKNIRDLIREEYLKTYNYEYVAKVLRNVPNFMIFDDHDFYDNFGFFEINDGSESSEIDAYFTKHARWYYYAYQKQLWEDINFDDFSKIEKEYHHMTINHIGLFFIDRRACRTWHKKPNDKYKLGKDQWDSLETCFGPNGLFTADNIKTVFLVTTTPIVLMAHSVVLDMYGMTQKEIYEQWSYDCPEEQTKLLHLMKDFREATKKEVVLITGDLHMAGCTDIYHDNKFIFKQYISSGIIQRCMTSFQAKMANFAFDFKEKLGDGFSFHHKSFTPHNNYGIIDVYDDNSIFCNWVKSWDIKKYVPTLGEPIYLNYIDKQKNGRCSCCLLI